MPKFVIEGKPVPKLRPRFSRTGKTYDCQKKEKDAVKIQLLSQIRNGRILSRLSGALTIQMSFHTPIPRSLSRKAANAKFGNPDLTRPDCDNFCKFYLDCMNQLIFEDDAQVFSLHCEKIYSDRPRVEIFIKERCNEMINEHAATVKDEITVEELNYMIKKANRLGLKDREVVRVFMQEDNEGKHYYFECEGMKPHELAKN